MTHNFYSTLDKICRHLESFSGSGVKIEPDTNLAEQFALDSVKILDLMMEIEDQFDVSIPLNIMADVQTVRDLAEVIDQLESGQ